MLTVILILLSAALLAGTVYLLAQMKIFFTSPKEGTVEVVVSGDSDPRFILAFRNHHLDEEGNVKPGPGKKRWIDHSLFGIYWVGVYPFYKIYTYEFRWTEWTQPQDNTTYRPVGRDEETSFIYVKDFPYYAKITDARTRKGELIPVDMEFILTTRCSNPYQALFGTEDWLAQVMAATEAAARNYVADRGFYDLVSEKDKAPENSTVLTPVGTHTPLVKEDDSLNATLILLNDLVSGKPGLMKSCGITIVRAEMLTIKMTPEAEKTIGSSATLQFVTEEATKATITKAKGKAEAAVHEANAVKTAADAEAHRISTIAKAIADGGENARLAQYYKSIAEAGQGGSAVIFGTSPGEISKGDALRYSAERQENKGGSKQTAPSESEGAS